MSGSPVIWPPPAFAMATWRRSLVVWLGVRGGAAVIVGVLLAPPAQFFIVAVVVLIVLLNQRRLGELLFLANLGVAPRTMGLVAGLVPLALETAAALLTRRLK